MHALQLKTVEAPPVPTDGCRILVERQWPRTIKKTSANIDLWLQELAPSAELQQRFTQPDAQWQEFQTRYRAELDKQSHALRTVLAKLQQQPVTLVFTASDARYNHAIILCAQLQFFLLKQIH